LGNEAKRVNMEKMAREVIEKNSGAVSRTVDVIKNCIISGKP